MISALSKTACVLLIVSIAASGCVRAFDLTGTAESTDYEGRSDRSGSDGGGLLDLPEWDLPGDASLPGSCPRLLADSVSEFSDTQEQSGWSYGFYVAPFDVGTFVRLNSFSSTGGWHMGSQYWTWIDATRVHPNGPVSWGGKAPVEHHVVRRWTSSYSGVVEARGTIERDPAQAPNGDGVTASIRVNGTQIWSHRHLVTSPCFDFETSFTVKKGDRVDLVVIPEASDNSDLTVFTVNISCK
jgi:hypothetical protein